MEKKKDSKPAVVIGVLCWILILFACVVYVVNLFNQGEVKSCTIIEAEHVSDYNAGAPTESMNVQTSDCGKIFIDSVRYPGGVNMAKLTEVLNENKGKKFEFVMKYVQLDHNTLESFGVKSLTPVG